MKLLHANRLQTVCQQLTECEKQLKNMKLGTEQFKQQVFLIQFKLMTLFAHKETKNKEKVRDTNVFVPCFFFGTRALSLASMDPKLVPTPDHIFSHSLSIFFSKILWFQTRASSLTL